MLLIRKTDGQRVIINPDHIAFITPREDNQGAVFTLAVAGFFQTIETDHPFSAIVESRVVSQKFTTVNGR